MSEEEPEAKEEEEGEAAVAVAVACVGFVAAERTMLYKAPISLESISKEGLV